MVPVSEVQLKRMAIESIFGEFRGEKHDEKKTARISRQKRSSEAAENPGSYIMTRYVFNACQTKGISNRRT